MKKNEQREKCEGINKVKKNESKKPIINQKQQKKFSRKTQNELKNKKDINTWFNAKTPINNAKNPDKN